MRIGGGARRIRSRRPAPVRTLREKAADQKTAGHFRLSAARFVKPNGVWDAKNRGGFKGGTPRGQGVCLHAPKTPIYARALGPEVELLKVGS